MALRFLHFSDIHFGQERNGEWEPYPDVRQEVLNDVRRVLADGTVAGPADAIIISGDVAQSGKEEEFKEASIWLEAIINASGCTSKIVQTVPGNHDINLELLGDEGIGMQKMLRNASVEDVAAHLSVISGNPDNPIWAKFAPYRSFAFAYGSDFSSYAKPVTIRHFDLPGGKGIRLVGLCTVMLSDRSDKPGNILLGANQYQLSRDEGYEDVYVMHHPFDWLRDRVEAGRYLNSRARMLITGHEHRPALTKIEHENGLEQLQLAAGATTPPGSEKGYDYSFNWIELDWEEAGEFPKLAVTVFPRVWSKTGTRFEADHARLKGRASKTICLACDPFRDARPGAPASDVAERVVPEAPITSLPLGDESATLHLPDTDEVASNLTDTDAFEKLRFLFWRHLARAERVDILINLGLLTEVARTRVPSAVERQAFEDAAKLSKLSNLWDKTMPHVPPGERADNPFSGDQDA